MALTKVDDRGLKTPIDLLDNEKIRLGTGNDIEFYHDGSNNFIKATNGNTSIIANQTNINNAADTENCATFISDGAVNLFHNGTKKFETTASGITVTGGVTASAASTFNEDVVFTGTTSGRDVVFDTSLNQMRAADNAKFTAGSSADLEVYHNGSNSFIDNYTGALYIRNNVSTDNGGNIVIQAKVNEDGIIVHDDGAVELYHNGSKKFDTVTNGVRVHGSEDGDAELLLLADEGDDNEDFWRLVSKASDNNFYLATYASGSWLNKLSVDTSGKVSVGGETAIYNFNVRGSGQQTLLVGSTDAGGAYLTLDGDSNGDGQSGDYCSIGHTTAGNLEIVADNPNGDANIIFKAGNAAEALRIDGAGKVGIGLTNPVNNLDVSGSVSATGNMLNTAYADGVYIGTNGGLPAITAGKASNSAYAPLVFRQDNTAAGAERMRINSSGQVLIGTTTGPTDSSCNLRVNFDQSTSSGRAIEISHETNGADKAGAAFGLAIDNGGEATNAATLTFATASGGSLGERMRIDSIGGLRVGTTSNIFNTATSEKASIKQTTTGNALTLQVTDITGGYPVLWLYSSDTTASQNAIIFQRTGGSVGTITTTASSTAYNTSSDYRLKENVTAISDGITRLKTLKPSRFNFKVDKDTTVDGFLAHEVTAVPEAITGTKDEVDSDKKPVYQGIDQSKLVPLLTAALQEAITKIETLETKVAALEAA